MYRLLFVFLSLGLFACSTTTYYISRHAEKSGAMSNNPTLTAEGEKQALDLLNYLKDKKISRVYATPFVRTHATAAPTSQHFSLTTQSYEASRTAALADSLRIMTGGNILVIGHSNTVDDLVNGLLQKDTLNDLPESEYRNLFIIKKKGNKYSYSRLLVPMTNPR